MLILGSLPSEASLRAREYYAHPQNAFWKIMQVIAGAEGDYAARCRSLQARGIAVWDVLSSSVRPGSLDADIDMSSAVPNDFEHFLASHGQIRLVCFNGRKAQQIFQRRVQPLLPDLELEFALLPSTSPAHASVTFKEKLTIWRGIIAPHLGRDGKPMADSQAILAPFLGMLLLTAFVWAYMYTRRLTYIKANNIPPQDLATPEKAATLLPEAVALPANNLRNLLELPVVFYALCLYLYVTASADGVQVAAAWAFVGLRTAHSIIHCTVNIVILRFLSYFAAALVLWFMLGRALLSAAGF